jgi:hypothetical protein
MLTRTDCAALRAQATSWRTPTSSGSSMAAFGSWSTRWSSHMLERWCAQPPPTHHQPLATPPQLAAGILVLVGLQEPVGPCKGVVMAGGSLGGAVHASPGSIWRTRLFTHGRSRAVLAMVNACLRLRVCLVSRVQTAALYRCVCVYYGRYSALSRLCQVSVIPVSSAVAVPLGPSQLRHSSHMLECRRTPAFGRTQQLTDTGRFLPLRSV